ncbi:CPXV054 protein, partial [Monkeypox virus]
YF